MKNCTLFVVLGEKFPSDLMKCFGFFSSGWKYEIFLLSNLLIFSVPVKQEKITK